MIRGLATATATTATAADTVLANPCLPKDLLQEAVPGSIRRAEHFLSFLRTFLEYIKLRLRGTVLECETPMRFLHKLRVETAIDVKPLKFTYSRLHSLLRTLQVLL